MTIKDLVLAEFDHEMGTTRRLLERVRDDTLAWKPHERSSSMGALASHLAGIPRWADVILRERFFDLARASIPTDPGSSREEILALFESTVRQCRAAATEASEADYLAIWSLRREDQELFSLPRVAALRTFVLNHIIHHRGQLSVYLRLNGIAVPAIYGPSADEG